LIRVSSADSGGATTTVKENNRYDINGIRKRKLDKNSSGSHEYTAGISTVASKAVSSSSSAPTISYVQGHQILGAEVNGNFQYWLGDHVGSTREVISDTGAVIRSMEFAEHGQLLNSSGTGTFAPKTYQGALSVNDDTTDSGLYMMGHRHYASELGRFISRDPIGFRGGLNLFGTAFGNNPVTFVDPSGLDIWAYQSVTQTLSLDTVHSGTVDMTTSEMQWVRYKNAETFVNGYNKAANVEEVIFQGHGSTRSMDPGGLSNLKMDPLDDGKVQLLYAGRPLDIDFTRVKRVRIWSCFSDGGYRSRDYKRQHLARESAEHQRQIKNTPATDVNLAHAFKAQYPATTVEGVRGFVYARWAAEGGPFQPTGCDFARILRLGARSCSSEVANFDGSHSGGYNRWSSSLDVCFRARPRPT
jgi:RHS repeat-associated protein